MFVEVAFPFGRGCYVSSALNIMRPVRSRESRILEDGTHLDRQFFESEGPLNEPCEALTAKSAGSLIARVSA